MERIGRRIRLNRSRLKETYDTNSDFDDLSESIRAGFYLKKGLSGNEELYYMSMLITITGYTEKEVEWRAREMAKLLNSQDIGTAKCTFSEEKAFFIVPSTFESGQKLIPEIKTKCSDFRCCSVLSFCKL